jgi:predicted  nucleic acid-binding Zn-ribbon protein
MSDAATLLELQEADYALLRLNKQLEELPQRAQILGVRAKRKEIAAKGEQVASILANTEQTIARMTAEADELRVKLAEEQAKMDTVTNYKEVEALSNEISGLAKRLEKIEFEMLGHMERLDKTGEVREKVKAAADKLEAQEQELVASFQKDGGALKQEVAQVEAVRAKLADALDAGLLKRYEKAVKAKGGAGAASLENGHCSGCRVEFTDGQMAKLRQGPHISECPYCHRILVT